MAGSLLLAILFFTLLFALSGLALRCTINGWIVPVAVMSASATVIWSFGFSRRKLCVVALTLAVIALAAGLCSLLTDQSYDGNAYHGETIGRLLDGWNPLYESADTPTIWVNCYAKVLEILEASVAAMTGNMESGKVVNLILAGAAVLLLGGSLRMAFPAQPKRNIVIVTILFGANPVLITQLFTFYNDYALYCCMLIVGAGMLQAYCLGWSRLWVVVSFVATMIGMGTKFTHGFYLGIEWCAFIILLLVSHRSAKSIWHSMAIAAAGAVIGLCVAGFHPYVTNMQRFGHPLYPLMGDSPKDIMSVNTPKEFQKSGRIVNFAKSVTMVKRGTYDQRHGGFGPFMAPMLILALVFLVAARREWQAIYVSCWLFVSVFCFEQTWWARYNPYLWAIIPVSVLASMTCSGAGAGRWLKVARAMVYTCVALTVALCSGDALWLKVEATMYRNLLYDGARRSGTVNVAIEPYDVHVRRRLDEAGISYRVVPRCEIDTARSLFLTNDGFRGDVIELAPDVFNDVTAPGWRHKLLRMQERTLDFHDDKRPCD